MLQHLPRLFLKEGVVINGLHFDPKIRIILDAALTTAPPMQNNAVWVTSANDGEHMVGSKHFLNHAFDIRIWNIQGDAHSKARVWVERMARVLGLDYDVILESDHIHAEYDPKGER